MYNYSTLPYSQLATLSTEVEKKRKNQEKRQKKQKKNQRRYVKRYVVKISILTKKHTSHLSTAFYNLKREKPGKETEKDKGKKSRHVERFPNV